MKQERESLRFSERFHGHAISALDVAREVATAAGLPEADYANPEIRVRLATWHDHHGDSDACIRVLLDVLSDLARHRQVTPGRLDAFRLPHRGAYGYAIARLDALGQSTGEDSRPLLESAGQSLRARDLRLLAQVCRAIAVRDIPIAIGLLDQSPIAPATMGAAELPRLRALAHLAADHYAEALTADRRAFRVAAAQDDWLRGLFVDGMAARLDHENIWTTRTCSAPSPGTRTKRSPIRSPGCPTAGTWKTMSAGWSSPVSPPSWPRVMRKGDFVARYGGDEFVVVLPGSNQVEAVEVAHRVVYAVRNEDWAALVPGTPVSITVGWAEANPRLSITQAFAAADHAMLHRKAR